MTGIKGLILLIEDEPQMRRFLRVTLQSEGYDLIETPSGGEGLSQAATRNPDVILLDLGLPDLDGLEVLARLREWSQTPIIILSARERERDKISALDSGADDYLTKPFSAGELLARIRVACRHKSMRDSQAEPVFVLDALKVDLAARRVFLKDVEVHLTPIEYKLLAYLVRNAGKVLTHKQLLKEVWGPAYADQAHYVRVYMGMLRHKLEEDPSRPSYFINEPGVGYRMRSE
ncbi:MAG TPA: response regulator [Dissulfurispiraceae bacterium]|nr:response regulator [Dissulfurispiraceae bacterium]